MIPDWQLPSGVDRGLFDYFRAAEMVRGYDEQMAASPLATADVSFCERHFAKPGRLIDLGCGTGRLAGRFAQLGHDTVGVDLSDEMLKQAQANAGTLLVTWLNANIIDVTPAGGPFDYAACLFSTWGMIRGRDQRRDMLTNVNRLHKPGGTFVLHVHNRRYARLGWKRILNHELCALLGRAETGDITMPQAYGGAPLTLHHATAGEIRRELNEAGFRIIEMTGVDGEGNLRRPRRWSAGTYGYLAAVTCGEQEA